MAKEEVMIVSAGQLHSSVKLIELVIGTAIPPSAIQQAKGIILVCPVEDVLNLCSRCGWVEVDSVGNLCPTKRGVELHEMGDFENRLRHQLRDIITSTQPAWSKVIMYGRHELARNAPPDIVQCFEEAALMVKDASSEVVRWWDELANLARGYRSAAMLSIGRAGERATLAFELRRTGRSPIWQSIESSFSGYDVLSVVSPSDDTPLQIEVKASEIRIKEAIAHVSLNEWQTAMSARAHYFHLWHIGNPNQLAVVGTTDMLAHIPTDQGCGKWESVKIPFSAFASAFQVI